MTNEDAEFEDVMRGMGLRPGARVTTSSPDVDDDGPDDPPPGRASALVPEEAEEFLSAMASLDMHDTPVADPAPRDREAGRRLKALTVGTAQTLQRRIRHGEIEAERELDLHRLRRAEARTATLSFVRRCGQEGVKVARVICGRGLHSKEHAVLQQALGEWLREDLVETVRDAVPAPAAMGGRGVWYLFLR